jgi:hypothetical protein
MCWWAEAAKTIKQMDDRAKRRNRWGWMHAIRNVLVGGTTED